MLKAQSYERLGFLNDAVEVLNIVDNKDLNTTDAVYSALSLDGCCVRFRIKHAEVADVRVLGSKFVRYQSANHFLCWLLSCIRVWAKCRSHRIVSSALSKKPVMGNVFNGLKNCTFKHTTWKQWSQCLDNLKVFLHADV